MRRCMQKVVTTSRRSTGVAVRLLSNQAHSEVQTYEGRACTASNFVHRSCGRYSANAVRYSANAVRLVAHESITARIPTVRMFKVRIPNFTNVLLKLRITASRDELNCVKRAPVRDGTIFLSNGL